jgi:hypothetical protein
MAAQFGRPITNERMEWRKRRSERRHAADRRRLTRRQVADIYGLSPSLAAFATSSVDRGMGSLGDAIRQFREAWAGAATDPAQWKAMHTAIDGLRRFAAAARMPVIVSQQRPRTIQGMSPSLHLVDDVPVLSVTRAEVTEPTEFIRLRHGD